MLFAFSATRADVNKSTDRTMKFRQFEFRLFPKLRSKKKNKRSGKLCNYDFPRDVGLDRNSNYSTGNFYDNFGKDTQCADDNCNVDLYHKVDNFASCYERYGFDRLANPTYEPNFGELRVNIDTCNCSECQNLASKPRDVNLDVDMNLSLAHGHNKSFEHAQSASPVWKEMDSSIGTPSTLPRMRTRIKTNPWLPSPGATPTLGPTGSYML